MATARLYSHALWAAWERRRPGSVRRQPLYAARRARRTCSSYRILTGAVELQESVSATVGRPVVEFFEAVGELSLLFSRSVGAILMGRISLVETLRQMSVIGVYSLPIVLITLGFSGMVLALQTAVQFHKLGEI